MDEAEGLSQANGRISKQKNQQLKELNTHLLATFRHLEDEEDLVLQEVLAAENDWEDALPDGDDEYLLPGVKRSMLLC